MQQSFSSALFLTLGAATLAGALPAQLGHAMPPPERLRANLAHLAIDETAEYSEIELLPGGDQLWNFPLLAAAQLQLGEPLAFVLPGGRSVELPLVDRTMIAQLSIGFAFADHDAGMSAEVVVHDGIVRGRFRGPTDAGFERWEFETDPAFGAVRFRPAPPEQECQGVTGGGKKPGDGAHVGQGGQGGDGDGGVAGGCTDTGALIDVLVAYTPAFAADFASTGSLESALLLDLASANAALANSKVVARYRSVGFAPLDQSGTGSLADDLDAIVGTDDGRWDEIHAARNGVKADLVTLCSDSDTGGIALLGVGSPAEGFSVVGSVGGLLLAHELGHNLGCCHAYNDGGGCDNTGGYFSFSLGHRFAAGTTGAVYRTVMAYQPGERIPYFSNPLVSFLGVPTGVPGSNPATAADNARTIALTCAIVANYRCSLGDFSDCDGDGVADDAEIAAGTASDCNVTGIPDDCDIALGISLDVDGDGVPDECPLGDIEIATTGLSPLDTLGSAVGVSTKVGDPEALLVVGAPGNDVGAGNAGVAYALRVAGGSIIDIDELRPGSPRANAFFGRGVAAYKRPASPPGSPALFPARNFALVGAYREDSTEPAGTYVSKGALYLFAQSGDSWSQVWRLTPSSFFSTFDYSLFGYSAAMGRNPRESADQIIVGCPGYAEGKGRIFIARNYLLAGLERGGIQDRRDLTNATAGDNFGAAVALEPALQLSTSATALRVIAIAGAPGRNNGKGSALVYDRGALFSTNGLGTFPTNPIVLTPPASGGALAEGDRFGSAVAISGPLIAVGAPGDDDGRGVVHFWERRTDAASAISANYLYRGSFRDPNGMPGDALGSSVGIAPDVVGTGYTIVVGAPKAALETPTGLKPRAGKAYVLRKTLGTSPPTLDSIRVESNPSTGDEFGYAASSTRGFSLIGVPFNDQRGLNAGKARLMTVP